MLIRQIPRHPRALKSVLDETVGGRKRGYSFVNEGARGVRRKDGWLQDTRGAVASVLLGDEANMHALGPAKLRLDRIALHCITRHYNGAPFSHGESEEEVEPEAS